MRKMFAYRAPGLCRHQSARPAQGLTTSFSSAIACSFETGFFRPRPSSGLYVHGGTKWLRL